MKNKLNYFFDTFLPKNIEVGEQMDYSEHECGEDSNKYPFAIYENEDKYYLVFSNDCILNSWHFVRRYKCRLAALDYILQH